MVGPSSRKNISYVEKNIKKFFSLFTLIFGIFVRISKFFKGLALKNIKFFGQIQEFFVQNAKYFEAIKNFFQ
jgi:hypothetical protein